MSLAESIVLVYDPLKTAQGMLSFRAFRITQRYLDLIKYEPDSCEYPDPTLEEIRRSKILSKVILKFVPFVKTSSRISLKRFQFHCEPLTWPIC